LPILRLAAGLLTRPLRQIGLALLLTCFALHARAEDEAGKWVVVSESVTSQVKPGWPGKTAGIGVDPASGDVYLVVPDQGLWKSSDQGQNFKRVDA